MKAVLVGLRPDSKLFTIVGIDRDTVACMRVRKIAEIGDGIFRIGKRNRITQLFGDRKESDLVSLVFGDVVAVQVRLFESSITKMYVIENGVLNASLIEVLGKRRVPTHVPPATFRLAARQIHVR